ncbi:MAG TPA: sigma-70 family RNA polymerase sigma factor [Dehalococcoidia bacterium]|nr:sigma-70 family RNA polymerase sigma factor [Dehalococcoidia bacterium]
MVIEADHRLESDSFLVAQAANGDESAYKALYERHHQHLLAVLTASMPAPIAEEAAQEAWARAYERINSLDRPQAFFAWLSTIARNYARDHHRATGSENLSLGDDHDWIPEPAPGPDTVVEQDEDRRLAARALQRLPDKQRAALLLRNLQGRSYVSIAGRLGLSVSATETLLHRARSNFQREYSSLQSGSDTPALACYKMRSSLRALSSGALSDLRRMRVIAHLESCEGCRSTQEEMRRTRRIAGFIPFFLPVAWVRDKLLHLGRGAADTAGKLAPGGGAGAGAGAAPAAIVGTMAVATLSTAAILSGIAFDVGVPFMGSGSSTDADHELVSDAASPLVFDPGIGLPPSGPGNFGQPPAGTNGIPPLGIPPVAGQFGFLDDDLLPTSDPPPGPPEAPGQQVAAAPDCITDPTLCQSDCQADPLACQPPGSPPCVDQDPNTEGCQEEPPCEDQDPNTEGCQQELPCEDQDPNTEGCQKEPPCEDQDPNTEGCQPDDPCDLNPDARECQPPDPCVVNPQAEECQPPCEDQDPNTEGCQKEPPCRDQDPNTEGCQEEPPCQDQDPNTEGCQQEPPCEDQDPNTEGCQGDSGDGGEGDDDCPGNSSNDHNCGADCDKPGQGDGNGYGHCKDNGETGGNSANAADIANDGKKEDDPGQDA